MLHWLYRHLEIDILQYTSVHAGISFFIAFVLTMYLMPKFIRWARAKKASQPIYELAPENHKTKAGTPTIGGVVFIFSTIITTVSTAKLNNFYIVDGILTLALSSLIGIQDDYSKISKEKNSADLTPRMKLIFQLLCAAPIAGILFLYGHSTKLFTPFYKFPLSEMGVFGIVFWMFVIVGSPSAVNLTDGLDGLATVPSVLAFSTLSISVYVVGHAVFANYLLFPNIQIAGKLATMGSAICGASIAFLWFSSHPAKVFMGGSGSLPLDAFMGYLTIAAKSEILLLAIGFIFVWETVSVILQVGSYKLRRRRVFLMAPVHHHPERKGWKENKIIVRFWIVAFMSNLIALLSLKIR